MPSLLYVGSEPPKYKDVNGYAGAHGRLLDRMLSAAGLARSDARVIQADEYRDAIAAEFDVVVLGGEFAVFEALGWQAHPGTWHGSVMPQDAQRPTSYDAYRSWCLEAPKFVITHDIPTLHREYELHPLAVREWQAAGAIARGEYRAPNPDAREWIVNQPARFAELAAEPVVVFDTELSPVWMMGFANSAQVHVSDWSYACEEPSRFVLQHPDIIKVAHNLQHDLAMCELRFGFEVKAPYFDTYGGAHLLNTALERTLSPGIASRFTHWPHHKWLSNVDATRYNGLDNIVCYDAYLEIARQLRERGLWETAQHDHKLLSALYQMQMRGFRVDEGARAKYEHDTKTELDLKDAECNTLAQPIIRARLSAFKKPGLFYVEKQCKCCGGGTKTRAHCWRCFGLTSKPTCKAEYFNRPGGVDDQHRTLPVAQLQQMFPVCKECNGTGKVGEWQPFNPGSGDQVSDVLYRGLRIPPRKYKGKETTKADQLKPIQDRHPLVRAVVERSVLQADLVTVQRLQPGTDGKLHCVFDPWGTESGRVASRSGLLLPGTNAMNIPKPARKFVVPDPGCILMYPDMAQIEARAVAMLSGDKGLIRAFTEPVDWPGHPKHGVIDSHTVVQQMVSKYLEITRDQAKRTTYLAMYGGSGDQLEVELNAEAMRKGGGVLKPGTGRAIIEAFFQAFAGVRRWHKAIEDELLQTKALRSPTGRERHWPGRIVDLDTGGVLRDVLKEAWSFKPQEIGAHILGLGLLEITERHLQLMQPLIHVHDALMLQCKLVEVEEAKRVAKAALSRELFGMWFPADMKAGANWYEAS